MILEKKYIEFKRKIKDDIDKDIIDMLDDVLINTIFWIKLSIETKLDKENPELVKAEVDFALRLLNILKNSEIELIQEKLKWKKTNATILNKKILEEEFF